MWGPGSGAHGRGAGPDSTSKGTAQLDMDALPAILQLGQELRPKSLDLGQEELRAVVDMEMADSSAATDNEYGRLRKDDPAHQESSGVKLEVNKRIFNSCADLMKAIRVLVTASTSLQKEIVESVMGAPTQQGFYAKNSGWTEGLISRHWVGEPHRWWSLLTRWCFPWASTRNSSSAPRRLPPALPSWWQTPR